MRNRVQPKPIVHVDIVSGDGQIRGSWGIPLSRWEAQNERFMAYITEDAAEAGGHYVIKMPQVAS